MSEKFGGVKSDCTWSAQDDQANSKPDPTAAATTATRDVHPRSQSQFPLETINLVPLLLRPACLALTRHRSPEVRREKVVARGGRADPRCEAGCHCVRRWKGYGSGVVCACVALAVCALAGQECECERECRCVCVWFRCTQVGISAIALKLFAVGPSGAVLSMFELELIRSHLVRTHVVSGRSVVRTSAFAAPPRARRARRQNNAESPTPNAARRHGATQQALHTHAPTQRTHPQLNGSISAERYQFARKYTLYWQSLHFDGWAQELKFSTPKMENHPRPSVLLTKPSW